MERARKFVYAALLIVVSTTFLVVAIALIRSSTDAELAGDGRRPANEIVLDVSLQPVKTIERWYTRQQVSDGARIFQQNCASCHGERAQSTPDWKKVDAQGNYPAPPLDGTAHTWHHDLPILRRAVDVGGIPLGGKMPAFRGILNKVQQDAVIAYFQNFWSDDIYKKWSDRFLAE